MLISREEGELGKNSRLLMISRRRRMSSRDIRGTSAAKESSRGGVMLKGNQARCDAAEEDSGACINRKQDD
jgi:hypothetical protein